MTHGFDSSFLVAAEVSGHPQHTLARGRLLQLRQAGDNFALAPQVVAEFIHVVTDDKRFTRPLPMEAALERSRAWWISPEVAPLWPDQALARSFNSGLHHRNIQKKNKIDGRCCWPELKDRPIWRSHVRA